MIAAHLSVTALPADGTSVGEWVRKAVEVLEDSGLKHEVHAMGTEIECETLEELLPLLVRIDESLFEGGADRVTIQLKVDDRRDKQRTLEQKARRGQPMAVASKRSTRRSQTR